MESSEPFYLYTLRESLGRRQRRNAAYSLRASAAKAVVREFQEKLYALLSQGEKTEVYQFNCQLFPLTSPEK